MSKNHFLPFQINTTIFTHIRRFEHCSNHSQLFFVNFGYPKLTFDGISGHFRSIRNVFLKTFTKWSPAPILDVRNLLSIAFLAISDQYKFSLGILFTKWLPSAILDVRNSLSIAFLAILDQYGIFYFLWIFFTKWPPAPILDVRNSLSIPFLAIM